MKTMLMLDADAIVRATIVWDGVRPLMLQEGWTVEEHKQGEYYEIGKPRGYRPPPPPVQQRPPASQKRKSTIT